MIEFTTASMKTSIASVERVFSTIANQVRRITVVLLFLALVMTIQPHSVNAATLGSVGLKHQAQGAIDKATGMAETTLSKTKGMAREVKGNVTGNIGRVESKVEGMKNKASDVVDDSKSMLDDLGDKIQSTADSIADSVKGLGK